MGSTKLKADLSNCVINFDRRILITELLDDYQLTYEEVDNLVRNYIKKQEKEDKIKFDKKFLVHGVQEGEDKKEIFKIVEEIKLKDWLKKLKNAESSLYSVEVAGGAKSAAPVFKPMRVQEGVKLKTRHANIAATTNGSVTETTKIVEKKEIKIEPSNSKVKETPKNPVKEIEVKQPIPQAKISPTDKKAGGKNLPNKKGINNFFAASSVASKKPEDSKTNKTISGVSKTPTPKKMVDFFKKQEGTIKTPTETLKKPANNTSIQLFDNEENEEEEVSSDEEEKLEALKRDIISSDVEMPEEDEDESKPSTSTKRRRILDSDEEDEDPPVKHEKIYVEEAVAEEAVAETYLDEDGFVITKKPKQKAHANNKSPATKKTPPVTMKISPKDTKKPSSVTSGATKVATNPVAKTKQAGIMNFFSKK